MKIFAAVFLVGVGSLSAQLTPKDLRVMKEVLPKEQEMAWSKIDWKVDLWEARREASKAVKPIYLWEMDGHPLGCV